MTVGNQPTTDIINQQLTNYALQLRTLMQSINNLSTQVNGQGAGVAYLEQVGYGSSADSANPGDQSDAAWAEQAISYMNTLAGVYFGTATQNSQFNFHNALSLLWCGQ